MIPLKSEIWSMSFNVLLLLARPWQQFSCLFPIYVQLCVAVLPLYRKFHLKSVRIQGVCTFSSTIKDKRFHLMNIKFVFHCSATTRPDYLLVSLFDSDQLSTHFTMRLYLFVFMLIACALSASAHKHKHRKFFDTMKIRSSLSVRLS